MKAASSGINKMGYACLAGTVSLAFKSESDPLNAWVYFLAAFLTTFVAIMILEAMHEIDVAHRDQKRTDRGLR